MVGAERVGSRLGAFVLEGGELVGGAVDDVETHPCDCALTKLHTGDSAGTYRHEDDCCHCHKLPCIYLRMG